MVLNRFASRLAPTVTVCFQGNSGEDDLGRQGADKQAHQTADDLQPLFAQYPFDSVGEVKHHANRQARQRNTGDRHQLVVPMGLADAHDQQRTNGAGANGQRNGQRNNGHVLLHVVGLDGRLALGHAQRRDKQHAARADTEGVDGNAEHIEDRASKQVQQYAGDQRCQGHFPGQAAAFLV